MYTEKVMDHFMHPRNVGEIDNASGVGTVGNAKCGDIMRIFLDIDENQVVRDAKFKTFGCGAAIATSSMATEMIIGKTIQEALEVTNKAVMEALGGLPPVKVHCSLLAEQAVHAALWDYAQKNNITIEGLKPPVNDVDELNAKQLSFDNLLVCFAPIERYPGDSGDVQQVSYISGGDAYYFSRGGVQHGRWEKASPEHPLRVYDKTGAEMLFNRGKSYLAIVDDDEWSNFSYQ